MFEYEELRIRVLPVARGRAVVLMNGPHQTAGVVATAQLDVFRAMFDAILDAEHTGRAGARADADMQELGAKLFAALLSGPLAACLHDSQESAAALDRRLRLRFELPGALADLPVEALRARQDRGGRLATGPRTSIVRSVAAPGLPGGRLPQPADKPEKLRVVVVVAEPRWARPGTAALPPLQLAAEVAALTAELRSDAAGLSVDHEIVGLDGDPVTRARIQAVAERTPGSCMVVLLGHGAPGGAVYLEEPDGTPDPVSGHVLAGDLAGANVRLVVLNLCGGGRFEAERPYATVAEELVVGGVPAVVAMQADVSDAAAALFTPMLLRTLLGNATLDEAVTRARIEMLDGGGGTTAEWATPVVVVHRQNGHGLLFKVRGVRAGDDPIARGAADLANVENSSGGIDLGRLVGAARHVRTAGEWNRLERLVAAGGGLRPEFDALGREAAFESAVDWIRQVCALLAAEDDPAPAVELLAMVRARVPAAVITLLEQEVDRARRAHATMAMARAAAARQEWSDTVEYCEEVLADHPDGYRDALALRETAGAELERSRCYAAAAALEAAEDWAGAGAMFEQLAGFRDAADRWHYCAARRALDLGDLPTAAEEFRAAGGYADAVARAEATVARICMAEERWAEAEQHWRRAALGGVDVAADLDYVRVRQRIEDGDWSGALAVLRGMADGPEVAELSCLVTGILALLKRDWHAALREFDGLPDTYLRGLAGDARRLATAGRHVAYARWGAALAELDGRSGRFAEEARRLAALAHAGRAEGRDDWPGVVAALRALAGPDRKMPDNEVADMLGYAEGRVAEGEGDWCDAEQYYAGVRPAYRDTGSRGTYARGRAAEDDGDLDTAISCYQQVLGTVEDAAQRLVRCRLAVAVRANDWAAALQQAELLDDPVERATQTAYAQGRLAEEADDWLGAASSFAGCRAHADAAQREAYALARVDEAAGRWQRALGRYGRIPEGERDVAERRGRLAACLAALPWADGLPDAGLVELPETPRPGPYTLLAPLGIDAGSSAREVNAAGFGVLRERRGRADQDALARLRNRAARLQVDAGMAAVGDPQALRVAMAALRPGSAAEMVAALRATAPADAGLVALLEGDVDAAVAEWDAALRRDPADTTVARNLALVREHRAARLRAADDLEAAAAEWLRCVGLWVMVLVDDEHWRKWGAARSRRYGLAVPDAELRTVREGIAQRLTDAASPSAGADQDPTVPAEHLAAALLRDVGGVAVRLGPDAHRIACGPARLTDAGLVDRFAALVMSLQPAPDADPAPPGGPDEGRLRCAFSGLGPSLMLLERGQPVRALAALPELGAARVGVRATCTVTERRAGAEHRAGCAECRDFHDHHPAYLLLPNRTTQLVQDAAWLTARAHVAIARAAALRDVPDVDAVGAALSAALDRGKAAGIAARTRDVVARAVYDLAEDLWARRGHGRAERVQRAAEFLDGLADGPLGGNAQVRAAMADVLNQRGLLRAGHGDAEDDGPVDLAAAEADLRAAVRLNPAPSTVRANLTRVLLQRAREERARAPWTTVADAAAVVADGLGSTPHNSALRAALDELCETADRLVLNTLSSEEMIALLTEPGTGDAAAVRRACAAAQTDPGDDRALRELRAVLNGLADQERSTNTS